VPIGPHFGWNFAARAIFSTTASGIDLDAVRDQPQLVLGECLHGASRPLS
jgi:hypothetical protein